MAFGSKLLFCSCASFAGGFIDGCFEFGSGAGVLFDVVLGDWFEFIFLIVGQFDFGVGESFEVVGDGDWFSFLFLFAVPLLLAIVLLVVAVFVVIGFLVVAVLFFWRLFWLVGLGLLAWCFGWGWRRAVRWPAAG